MKREVMAGRPSVAQDEPLAERNPPQSRRLNRPLG